ncbi:MAG TPA: HAD-IC family P-type ATPase [Streptosporangiaceae bacterium]|nr:HAD-IC family P-type ATPase [Streptosporangiaceae bacterium]
MTPDLAGLVTGVRRAVRDLQSPRVAWRGDGRVHIRVRGLTRGAALPKAVEAGLADHPAVRWAAVNAPLGVVIVACAGDAPVPELIAIVERLENEYLAEPQPPADRPAAVDRVPVVAAPLAAAAAGLAFAGLGRALRIVRLPAELGSLVQLVDTQPRLRAVIERAAGAERADLALAAANTLAQSAAQGVGGLALDLGQRAAQLAEAVLQRDAWARAEPALCRDRRHAAASPVTPERPRPLPPGPVERYAEKIGLGAAGAFGGVLVTTGSPQRAAGVALAGLPKAARLGPEGFATVLGCLLARRGVVVTDHRALRRLDRVDTIVIDTDALTTGALAVGDVLPLRGADAARLTGAVHALFPAGQAGEAVADGAFMLGPLGASGRRGDGARLAARLADHGAARVLGLTERGRLRAVVGIVPEPAAGADLVLAAATAAGAALCLAGPGAGPATASARRAGAARLLPGGRRLLASVRGLQADGAAVLLVSGQRRALAAADVGVGLASADGRPAWGAHILAATDLAAASLLIDAVPAARAVSGRGIRLSQAGTALGASVAVGGAPPRAAARSLLAVNGAAAIALAGGAWSAAELARRPAKIQPPAPPWHAMPADVVLARLASRPSGLTSADARRRWHPDESQPRAPSLGRAFWAELANPLTPILGGGAALSASIGAVTDAVIVSGVCVLSALMGSVQRVYTERSMARLVQASAVTARVLRDGAERTIPASGLVSGDVVLLAAGDVVPADCRLLDAQALQADESTLTGESVPVDKAAAPVVADAIADRRSMLYEGTTIAVGRASAVVVATGAATEVGRSLAALSAAAPVTGVEARLSQITRTTLPIALGSAVAVVGAGLLRGRPARDTIGAAVGLAVASVPEGLPFLVTAAQLASARRLAGHGALVRNPRTIEALGRVNVLCFDKTGTLTQGRMALAAVSDGTAIRPLRTAGGTHREVLAAALRATPAVRRGRRAEHLTDQAVTDSARARQVTRSAGQPGWRRADALPFEPSRAFHATLAGTRRGPLLSVKGAPEVILPRCARWRGGDLGPRERGRLSAQLDRLAQDGYRVLAVAENHVGTGYRLTEQPGGMTFSGFVAFGDPVRATAGVSVRELREAGVHIVMITGDHPVTATAIATELDVLNGGSVITGAELDRLEDRALPRALAGATVIARCTPEHKVRIVRAFQAAGRVVAMTGDGANDAAAIRLADVGIALGRRGTPAARAAADLVVGDDRLETIIAAIVEGRAMWRSVRQAVGILVGGNIGEIGYTLFGTLLSGTSPLSARQLLLVNLLTDLVPALTVALRVPPPQITGRLLAEGPDTSLGSALTEEIAVRAATTGVAASGAWLAARMTGSPARARTVGLAAVIGAELAQTLLVGGRSPAVALASLGSLGVLVLVVQTPGVSQFFGCTPIGPVGWSIAAVSSVTATAGSLLLPRAGRSLGQAIWSLASPRPAREAGSPLAGTGAGAARPAQAGPRQARPGGQRDQVTVPAAGR